ncbi:MAG: WbqC family protein [Bacteroidia bacterium]
MKKLFIIQTNYIPWKGYFDAINMVDEVILYDSMQYTKNDWRNRNKIKTVQGAQWLTIPIDVKGKLNQRIDEAVVSDQHLGWRENHWKTIQMNYSKAPHFKLYLSAFRDLYKNNGETYLSKINYSFITLINSILGIKTPMRWSSEFELKGDKNEKLVNICKDTRTTDYFTGPSAKSYLNEALFEKEGIKVHYLDYSSYPEYKQLYGDFIHELSIVDLIFNEGPNMHKYMKSF